MNFTWASLDDTVENDSADQANFTIFKDNYNISMAERSKMNLIGYLEVVLAILLMVCNIFIVAVILSSRKLRNSSKHLLILNLSFVDLIKVISLAITVYMNFAERLVFQCDLQYISKLIIDLTTALSGVFIFLLNIDYIASVNSCGLYPGTRMLGPVLLSFFAYIITGATLVPLYVLHIQPDDYGITAINCWPFSVKGTFLVYEALCVVPQTILILVSGGMTIGSCISRSYLLNISKELNLVRRPVDINIAGFLTFCLHVIPYVYTIIYRFVCVCIPCEELIGLSIVVPLFPFIKCVLLPFAWLLCPDIRQALSQCCTKRQKRVTIKVPPVENDKTEFNNGKPEQITEEDDTKEEILMV